jgi:hypothetical protein
MPFPFLETTNDYSPINDIKTVTPNDGADLPNGECRGLFVTAAGTVALVTHLGTTVTLTFPATACGVVQYIRAKRILATGTTSTVLACY